MPRCNMIIRNNTMNKVLLRINSVKGSLGQLHGGFKALSF